MSDKFSPARIVVALLLLIACTQTLAHEGWILTPAEILEWNNKQQDKACAVHSMERY